MRWRSIIVKGEIAFSHGRASEKALLLASPNGRVPTDKRFLINRHSHRIQSDRADQNGPRRPAPPERLFGRRRPTMSDLDCIWRKRITDRSAWTRQKMERDRAWLHHLTARYLAEIDAVVEGLRRNHRILDTVTRSDFPFSTFGVFLKRFLWHDIAERGIGLIRGLPAARYTPAELGMLFWGIGMHLGVGVSQDPQGERLGNVRSQGVDLEAVNARGYQTTAHLGFHNDPSDVVGLFCVNKAKQGGSSSVVSATSIYNIILAERPQYLPLLYQGFSYDRRGQEMPYLKPISDAIPVFAHVDGELSMRYVRQSIDTARKKLGVPLSALETEVLDYLDSLTKREDLALSMMLEPGDMQFVNNYTVLHSRTAYVDHDEPERWRHLYRLWLKIPGFRKLDPALIEFDAGSGWSRREGIMPRTAPMPKEVADPLFV